MSEKQKEKSEKENNAPESKRLQSGGERKGMKNAAPAKVSVKLLYEA
ncbi:hypothetical protein GCM10010217_73390 [Streptomyces tubercidicus]